MLALVLYPFLAFLLYRLGSSAYRFHLNIQIARKSGIPYVLVPIHWLTPWWLVTHRYWIKYLRHLPNSLTKWVDFALPEFSHHYRHEIYERVGHDTFLTVSPTELSLFTCEPAVISQITTRRNDFPKPIQIYLSLDIYGKNVVSTEGQNWRHHRKATSPPFTEKNNHLVWSQSIKYAQSMVELWLAPDGGAGPAVDRIMDDTMRLALYVISGAGFGRSLRWPSRETFEAGHDDHSKIQNLENEKDPGHSMSWIFALHTLLDTILIQFLVPRWLVRKIPTNFTRKAAESYDEWGKYMTEAVEQVKQKRRTSDSSEVDILDQLVKSQMDVKGSAPLTESEIMGNMFVLVLAGHETAANSIHFSILYLALHPESQRRLQEDLDRIFGGRPPSEWNYDKDLPALFGGMAGAILAEELRLIPPVVHIPKGTYGVGEQSLIVDGKECTVPPDIQISLATSAGHRNPKYWPTQKPTLPGGHTVHPLANLDNDLEEFHPERWFIGANEDKEDMQAESVAGGDLGVNMSADTSEKLYRPAKGSYLPFSEGYRACLGRRFAQVEVLAVLAVLYQNYSIELALDKYAGDEEVLKMDINDRAEVWQKVAEEARELMLTGMGVIITLQMRKGTVPIRVVPRGQERFPPNIDEIWKTNHPDKVSNHGIPGWCYWKSGA